MAEKKKETKSSDSKKTKSEKKFTLLELVKNSDKPFFLIKPALMENGLLDQYYSEKYDFENGKEIAKSITFVDFNKIINEFIEREI